ncbi:mannitol 1-phosphate dehydrogenase [Colletotrichum scovillei]|uniref:Mannitol 1-phosphate dehydrogenase n=3 Tax=Colletotrichum acutatum species complex TaxID=2707335 RepID=A0A9P7R9U8_9PEZI|nr:mannitol 1-phosphate dehydrogenase [Colletotrichum scovillei]KXH36387.1 mannitol 1-phosphate dehydrogenase [Colletotrichum simmondsii]KAF4777158.1 mannitol 1-phosphate dehydrogenase [Colletotrichum scovillei]KAG7053565.1 mannitol 1-phosphate dehydrogenase [Colletotrichum scovillei]KAG7071863.1 mannitol 1-phosphate dehydrogenase [Colletotrichum scovillei]KAG7080109.1 mannitol 1-phosphate dehydrogenase [Colletotrichum scovillei]
MAPPEEFCQTPNKPFNVAVVGGGIAGLTLTLQLLQNRIPTTLYEQAPKFGEIGAGVSFGPNALRAMSLISPHVRQAFENQATHNESEDHQDVWFDFRYGQTCNDKNKEGDLIYRQKCETGQTGIHRAHFLDELVKLLPDGVAVFGKRAEKYEDDGKSVLLTFQDGTTARHDAVIACDGIKSRLRSLMLGEDHPASKAVFSGKYAYRGLIPMEEAEKLLGEELAKNAQMYFGRNGHILTFSVAKGKIMNVVAFASAKEWKSDKWVVSVEKEDMIRDFEGWGEKSRQIIQLMQKPDVWALFEHPPSPTYFEGRLCLLGDAAHASTPHKGSGAGMAIEDAYILGNLLGSISDASQLEAAFSTYDKTRRERSQQLVVDSHETGQLYDLEFSEDSEWVADNLSKRMEWIWKYDLTDELERGKKELTKEGSAETRAQL